MLAASITCEEMLSSARLEGSLPDQLVDAN
jgi:hypothetical protein